MSDENVIDMLGEHGWPWETIDDTLCYDASGMQNNGLFRKKVESMLARGVLVEHNGIIKPYRKVQYIDRPSD